MKKNKSKKSLTLEDLEVEDYDKVIKEAIVYQSNTPESFKKLIEIVIVNENPSKNSVKELESSAILRSSEKELEKPEGNCVIIDTRSYSLYLRGHFPQSFCLSSDLNITTGK